VLSSGDGKQSTSTSPAWRSASTILAVLGRVNRRSLKPGRMSATWSAPSWKTARAYSGDGVQNPSPDSGSPARYTVMDLVSVVTNLRYVPHALTTARPPNPGGAWRRRGPHHWWAKNQDRAFQANGDGHSPRPSMRASDWVINGSAQSSQSSAAVFGNFVFW